MALRTFYPKENILPNKESMKLWYIQLEDIPYTIAEIILKKWTALNKWSPSIAEIRQLASEIVCGDIPEWGKAWESVCKAISHFGVYRAKEALNSLEPLAKQAAEQIGFRHLCLSEKPETDRANFRMIYENLAKNKKQNNQIPKNIQKAIKEIQIKMLEEGQ